MHLPLAGILPDLHKTQVVVVVESHLLHSLTNVKHSLALLDITHAPAVKIIPASQVHLPLAGILPDLHKTQVVVVVGSHLLHSLTNVKHSLALLDITHAPAVKIIPALQVHLPLAGILPDLHKTQVVVVVESHLLHSLTNVKHSLALLDITHAPAIKIIPASQVHLPLAVILPDLHKTQVVVVVGSHLLHSLTNVKHSLALLDITHAPAVKIIPASQVHLPLAGILPDLHKTQVVVVVGSHLLHPFTNIKHSLLLLDDIFVQAVLSALRS